jgi:SAM-dependent methyltransferase
MVVVDEAIPDYIATNLANWNSRVAIHEQGYRLEVFRADPSHISDVVRFDLPRLGSVDGLDGVHLQCHIGTDTLSLSRLGARMTGLDFSAPALDVASRLAADCGAAIQYVVSDLYNAPQALGTERFDFVFTGVGALCWLPDVRQWARVVAALLRPGGFLFIREGHPMLWTLCDARPDGLVVVEFPYFETAGTVFNETTTYVEHEGELESPTTVGFNHGMAQIITAVHDAGLRLVLFEEHDSVPWNALDDEMVADEMGEYRLREHPERLAASYTLRAVKDPSDTLRS